MRQKSPRIDGDLSDSHSIPEIDFSKGIGGLVKPERPVMGRLNTGKIVPAVEMPNLDQLSFSDSGEIDKNNAVLNW